MKVLFCIRRPVIIPARTLKMALENFHVIFLNNDFSLDIALIPVKLIGNVLYDTLEGGLSQNFDLGPG